jgi:hypothetical protein
VSRNLYYKPDVLTTAEESGSIFTIKPPHFDKLYVSSQPKLDKCLQLAREQVGVGR